MDVWPVVCHQIALLFLLDMDGCFWHSRSVLYLWIAVFVEVGLVVLV